MKPRYTGSWAHVLPGEVPAWTLRSRQERRGSKTLACNALGSEMRCRGPWGSGRDPQQRVTTPGDGVQGTAGGGAEGTGGGLWGVRGGGRTGREFLCCSKYSAEKPGSCSHRPRSPAALGDSLESPRSRSGAPGVGWGARRGRPPPLLLQAGCPSVSRTPRLRALPTGSTATAPSASRFHRGRGPGCPVVSDEGEKDRSSLISVEVVICRYLGKVFKAAGLRFFLKNSAGVGASQKRKSWGPPLPRQKPSFWEIQRGKQCGCGLRAGRVLSQGPSLGQFCAFVSCSHAFCLQRLTHVFIFRALLSKCESEIDAETVVGPSPGRGVNPACRGRGPAASTWRPGLAVPPAPSAVTAHGPALPARMRSLCPESLWPLASFLHKTKPL